ncbi:MAG: thiol reductant ABC exporter subunit CydD [Bermanella sp.]
MPAINNKKTQAHINTEPKNAPVNEHAFTGAQFLKQYIKQERMPLRLAVLAGSLSTVLMITQWVCFVLIAQKTIINEQPITDHIPLLIVLIGCLIGKSLLTRVQTSLSQKASLNIRQNIRNTMLAQWRSSSPVYLKNTSTGAFASQFIEEIEAMDGYFSRYWPQQALAIISPLLILIVIAMLNWLCAIVLIMSAPLIPLFMILVGMGAERLNQKYSTIRQRLAGHFLDRVSNLSNIIRLGARQSVFEEVKDNSDRYRNVVMKTLKLAFLSSTVLEFFTSVAIATLAIYIGFSLYGAITWGPADSLNLFSGLTILILAPEFFQPLRNLSQFYHDRASALGAANNLVESLVIDSNISNTIAPLTAPYGRPPISSTEHQDSTVHLQFSNLMIGYEKQLIQIPNLELKTGELLVITGDSGSGKTTLLNTLAKFIPAVQGEIHITPASGNPIAYLPQRTWIKNDTVYENLIALAPNASNTDMMHALDKMGLSEELDINHQGLDTIIGEHGKGLSGGQMQRLAFTRVLLNPTPIILFDEPTAQLDLKSKRYIVDALKTLKSTCILVIASHDPLLVKMSDTHLNLNSVQQGKR